MNKNPTEGIKYTHPHVRFSWLRTFDTENPTEEWLDGKFAELQREYKGVTLAAVFAVTVKVYRAVFTVWT